MITLNASGGSITFEFSGNSTYLNDGTITVPVNSLALIIDESDMATFRKAASNDIFVSANIAEFGMTKAELESWFKENAVGSTGGGITSGEVQSMIDEAVSGKVDADFDNSLGFDINDDLGVYAEGNSEYIVFNTASSKVKEYTFPSVYTNGSNNLYKVGYNSSVSLELNQSFSGTVSATQAIGVKYLDTNDELKECWWDYNNNAFTINSDYSANNSVRLTYSSSNHKITLSRQSTSLKTIVTIMVGGDYYIASSSNPTEADCYISYIKIYTPVKKLQSVLNEKQRKLTAGDGIKLDYYGNISANIKVTGDTYTNVLNSESATTYINLDGIKNLDMWLNQSYTGTPSGWYTISVRNLDNSYDYYLYENDAFTLVSGSAGSTLNYDSSTGKVTITCPSGISYLQNGYKFAPKDDLTNADCFIGLVSYTSNEYTLQEAIDNKQDTLSAGTGIEISGNVISATGGGGGCEVEETVLYDRLKLSYYDYDGNNKVTYALVDYLGDKTIADNISIFFEIGDTSESYGSWIYFDYINHSANTDASISDYVTLEYINDIQDFKVSVASAQSTWWIRQISGLQYNEKNALIPYYTINSGSPCTVISTDVVGLVEKVKDTVDNSLKMVSFQGYENKLEVVSEPNKGFSNSNYISLEELDASNSVLKPNIQVGLGVSGWTEMSFYGSCNTNGNPKSPIIRLSGDTSSLDLEAFNTQWEVYLDHYGNSYDNVYWNGSEFVLSSNWFGENGQFGTASVTYDDVNNTLTIAYPLTAQVYDHTDNVELRQIYNPGCRFGTAITKLEYYAELQQALKPYVQETRAALGGLSLVKLTKAEYDALSPNYDNNTLYVVIPNP